MRATLVVLALWASYVTAVHVLGGAQRVVGPLREARVEPFARGTLLVVWHMVTWALVTLTAAIALAALTTRFGDLVVFAGVQAAGFSAVFLVTARGSSARRSGCRSGCCSARSLSVCLRRRRIVQPPCPRACSSG